MRIACLLSLLLLPGLAGAEIYRWVDEDGVVHYGDRPPNHAEQVEELPELQSMQPVAIPEEDEAPSVEPAPPPQVRIEQPRPEQTFHDPRGRVPATVALSAELASDQRLVYHLDGRPVGEPTRSRRMRFEGVVRGEHRLNVAVVAGDEEIARSETVTFFMQPPTALSPAGSQGGAPSSGGTPGAPTAPRSGGSP
jgi:hypothetical protein